MAISQNTMLLDSDSSETGSWLIRPQTPCRQFCGSRLIKVKRQLENRRVCANEATVRLDLIKVAAIIRPPSIFVETQSMARLKLMDKVVEVSASC